MAPAGEEFASFMDDLLVILVADAADARRRAPADLVLQARARAAGKNAVGAGAEGKGPLQGVDSFVDRARGCKGPEILASPAPRTPGVW